VHAGSVFGSRRPALAGHMREGARASQRMLVFELMQISCQHAPCPQLSASVLGYCPPEKGSRGAGVVVGVRGAGKAHPGQVIICRLVPDPGGVRCSLGCSVGHSPWSRLLPRKQ